MNVTRSLVRCLLTGLALAALSAPSLAQSGFDLRWGTCPSQGGLVSLQINCSDPQAIDALVATVVPGVASTQFTAFEATLDIASESGPLPAWWDPSSSSCNGELGNLFMARSANTLPVACNRLTLSGSPVVSYAAATPWAGDPARSRIVVYGHSTGTPRSFNATTEYALFALDHLHDTGVACPGCTPPVVKIALREVILYDCDGSRAATITQKLAGRADSVVALGPPSATVTIDARALGDAVLSLNGSAACLFSGRVHVLRLPIGPNTIDACATGSGRGIRPGHVFSVEPDGTVSYAASAKPGLQGAGTRTLVVNSLPK